MLEVQFPDPLNVVLLGIIEIMPKRRCLIPRQRRFTKIENGNIKQETSPISFGIRNVGDETFPGVKIIQMSNAQRSTPDSKNLEKIV